jgi:bifunctional N-acetylglucosamine-1-phosphate-uridyltransferase/glucosamine-1-phosphate-acetyltransferase GlmU-like protein
VIEFQEFFITDIVEFMRGDGLKVGYVVAENEDEIMGVDDLPSLKKAQELFRASAFHSSR